jgi:glycerophosphoryl diester phosphodiesterase
MNIIGHRGARGLAPENTLASIQKALDCGVDEVEVDVRITRDGVPVLSHDRLIVVESKPLLISSHALAELRTSMPELATLEEAIAAVKGRAVLRIEIKHGEPVGPVADVIMHLDRPAKLRIGSKSQRVLRESHALLPDIPKVVIEPWSGVRAHFRARQIGTKHLSMRAWWLWRGFLRSMHRRGYQIDPYTMNDPRKVAKWAPYISGIVTDYPDRFKTQ